jgi:hypothetical protein
LNLEVFCCIGLLCFPEQLDRSLALFPEAQYEQARKVLEKLGALPRSEVLQQWSKLRIEEYVSMARDLSQQYGIDLDRLPLSLQPWCSSWWAEHHG